MDSEDIRTVKFPYIGCKECGEFPLIGARWRCDVCHEHDACTTCYLSGKHNADHTFVRFDAPGCVGIKIISLQRQQIKQYGGAFDEAYAEEGVKKDVIFRTVYCDACGQREILGTRWKCAECFNYDLCTTCHRAGLRWHREGEQSLPKFEGIYCDSCEQRPITGTRWKCALCIEYDLCTTCYVGGQHDLDHTFLRVDAPGATAEMVASGKGSQVRQVENVHNKDVIFCGVNCDGCGRREIVGARWECEECTDYNLCTCCYMGNRHNLDHVFWRFDSPSREGLNISPRNKSAKVDARAVLRARTPRESTDGDNDAQGELVTKLRELESALMCAICMEGRRNVAFLCGHSACADCAKKLSTCHICRKAITTRIVLY